MRHSLLALAGFLAAAPLSATVYYVDSVNGSDFQNGRSAASAWSTLSRATSTRLSPGDYLLLKRGSVWHEPLVINSSGAPDVPIVVGAYGTGGSPLIEGSTESANTNDLLMLSGKTDVVVDGLQLRNGPKSGLNLNDCARVTLRNLVVAANRQFGMLIYNCSSVTIENSEISSNGLDTSTSYDGIRIDGSGGELSGFIVRGNNIHHNIGGDDWNSANGIFLGHTGSLAILRGVQILGNELAFNGNPNQNQAGRGLTGPFSGDILVANNYIHDSASAGIYLGELGMNLDITLARNVFYNNALRQFGGYTTSRARAFQNAVFVDNPNITAMGAEVGGTGSWQITNNVFYYQNPSTDTFRGFIRINDAAQDKNLSSDSNLFYSPGPDRWKRSDGIPLSFQQWVGYGFDLNGKNPF